MSNAGFCLRVSWRASAKYTISRILYTAFLALSPLILLRISKELFYALVVNHNDASSYSSALFLLGLSSGISLLIKLLEKIFFNIKTIHDDLIEKHIAVCLTKKSMEVDIEFFDTTESMDLMKNASSDSVAVINHVWNLNNLFSSALVFGTSFFALSSQHLLYAVIITLISIPSAYFYPKYIKKIYHWKKSTISEERKKGYLQLLATNKSFAPEIRLFNIKNHILEKYSFISDALIFAHKKTLCRGFFPIIITSVLPDLSIFIMMSLFIKEICLNTKNFGDYTFIMGLLLALNGSISSLLMTAISIMNDNLQINMFRKFVSESSTRLADGTAALHPPINIEFRNVTFKYPGSSNPVLNNLTFDIKQSEKVYIVGKNGCGKSTIIKLLLRQYDATSGSIFLNGKNITEYSKESLLNHFSAMFQDCNKYAFPLQENIGLSDINKFNSRKSSHEIVQALKSANAEAILERVQMNLDIPLSRIFSSKGIELSGGEIQKIAIARALYKNASILLFDEPSSNLDTDSAYKFTQNCILREKDKTVITVTHKSNLLANADRILVIDRGRLAEQGSHDCLSKKGGIYSKLFQAK